MKRRVNPAPAVYRHQTGSVSNALNEIHMPSIPEYQHSAARHAVGSILTSTQSRREIAAERGGRSMMKL